MNETQIKFSAQGIERIRNDASQLLRDVLRENEQYNDSLEEGISLFEKRAKLLETINRNEAAINRARLEERRQRGSISDEQYQSQKASLKLEELNSDILSKTMREMLEQLRLIVRTGAESADASEQLVNILGFDKDSDELNELIDKFREERNERQVETEANRMSFNQLAGFALSNLIAPLRDDDPRQSLANLTTNTGSTMMMMGGKAGIAGLILSLVGGVAGMVFDQLEEIEGAARANIQIRGGQLRSFYEDYNIAAFRRYADYGYSVPQLLQRNAELSRARGRDMGIDNTGNLAIYERAFGIDSSLTEGLQRSMRGNNISLQDTQYLGRIIASMQTSGMAAGGDFSYLNEYLGTLVDLSEKQLNELGDANLWNNNVLLQSIASIGEKFQNPQLLRNVYSGMIQGLSTASTPQVEALQFDVLSRIMPDASLWELEKAREQPMQNSQYLSGMMNRLREFAGGDIETMSRSISNIFFGGGRKQISEDIVNAFIKNGDFIGEFEKSVRNQTLNEEMVLERARQSTTSKEYSTAEWQGVKQGTVARANELLDSLIGIFKGTNDKVDTLNQTLETNNKLVEKSNKNAQRQR